MALGAESGTAEIPVAGNSDSSSLLAMGERHVRSDPASVYVGTETVEVSTIDEVWHRIARHGEKVFLKLDVQGFELEALRGAERSLPRIHGAQVEPSAVPLNEGAPQLERGDHPPPGARLPSPTRRPCLPRPGDRAGPPGRWRLRPLG